MSSEGVGRYSKPPAASFTSYTPVEVKYENGSQTPIPQIPAAPPDLLTAIALTDPYLYYIIVGIYGMQKKKKWWQFWK